MYSDERLSEAGLLDEHSTTDNVIVVERHTTRQPRRTHHACPWISQALLFLASASMLFLALILYLHTQHCKDYTPTWSPALEATDGTGHLHRFDGSFATPNTYKGSPSPSIDAAWEYITYENGGVFSINEATLQSVNASRDFSVQLAPEVGGGYMASVEVLHQLHCLNMLRQATYEDYYRDKAGPWKDSPQTLRYHLDHCIDNLRQKLMCDADAEILTYVWVKDHAAPFPDFNVQHKCRDFQAVRDWVAERQVYTKDGFEIERQPGFRDRESPP